MAAHESWDHTYAKIPGNQSLRVNEESNEDPARPSPSFTHYSYGSNVGRFGTDNVFKPVVLRVSLMPTLDKLFSQDESAPFRQPVDPTSLGIPDYFDIIKKPMDLSTIKGKLENGAYADPWEFIDDVWLMFNNAWLYNRKMSPVYQHCSKLSEVFEAEIEPVMQNLGYCCGQKYSFNPQTMRCNGKNLCTIQGYANYYSYENRYTYCQSCFRDIQGKVVTLDDPEQPQEVIKKKEFVKMTNGPAVESFVACSDCGRKFHQICVLHLDCIWPHGFCCDNCLKSKGIKRKENKFNAKELPTTKLGTYIETRVNNFLKKQEAGAGEVFIRVLSSYDKVVEVKPGMRTHFVETGKLQETFPYRAKSLFAFQNIDGTDVCFFGMHVQEYGSECAQPNTRRVYIAYLDSVHYFRPRQFRTAVYHEILLGYLEYVKQLGYTMAHIWACSPLQNDEYIFYCHPPEQKNPKPKQLQDWYKKLLDKGITEGIVSGYKDILKQAEEEHLSSAAELPYFEGDFWPDVLEDFIRVLDKETNKKRPKAKMVVAAADSTDEKEVSAGGNQKGKMLSNDKVNKRKRANAHQTENELTTRIYEAMQKHRLCLFAVRLHSAQSAPTLPATHDPDPVITCDLMDGRDAFLTLAKENKYEFSSLRRTKFSTMAMLYMLHNQGLETFVYICDCCEDRVETRYHCTVCDEFDLCVGCYQREGHSHKMEKFGFDLEDGGSSASTCNHKRLDLEKGKLLTFQQYLQRLEDAFYCTNPKCETSSQVRDFVQDLSALRRLLKERAFTETLDEGPSKKPRRLP